MNIGELAQRTGLTPSRIRFYESAGLLKTVARPHDDNRTYPPETMLALTFITAAQQVGFSLDEIRPLLPPGRDGWDHAVLLAALRRKVAKIESLETRLAHSKVQLVSLMRDVGTRPDGTDREACAQRVLSRVMGKTA
jgi:DNA-binding transcriptional MerR regulator